MEIKKIESVPNELEDDDDEIDELFGWAANTFSSGGTNLNDYTCTVQNGTVTSISDGTATVTMT